MASLTETIGGVTTTIGYVYDAQQQRLQQTTGSSVVRYLNDPASGISAEYHNDAGGTWHEYLFAEGRRVGLRIKPSTSAASWQAYVPDHLGSVAVVTDGSGSVLQRLSYDAWGLRRNPNGSDDSAGSLTAPTSRGFTDHEHLPVVGLINMNARMYDPELGRFLSPDSYIPDLLNSEALNRYSYVYNNPLAYTDPTGHAPLEDAILVGGMLPIPSIEKIILTSALHILFSLIGGDDDVLPPPLLHWPGLSSVNEDMQASPRLHDVTPSTGFQSMEAGWSMWGGYLVQIGAGHLRYESPNSVVVIDWDVRSGEIDAFFGLRASAGQPEDLYSLTDVCGMEGVDDRKTPPQIADETRLQPFVDQLADHLRVYAQPAFVGDRMFFRRLERFRSVKAEILTRGLQLQHVRSEVEKAWQSREFKKVVRLYESVEDSLSKAEKRRLEYARRHHAD